MDEPFSALDVLTAETLRSDFLDLWAEGELPIKGVILVTHNVEEAVLMCDRVLIFSTNPARIVREIKVTLPQPRARLDPAFRAVVEQIYVEMTTNQPSVEARPRNERFAGSGIGTVLPRISTNVLSGLIETVAGQPYQGKADLPVIAASLQMEIDDLFRAGETLQLLRFAEVAGGDIRLTDAGKRFADAEVDERKQLFARQLLTYVPLVAHIRRVLDERPSHVAPRSRFFDELEDYMTTEDAEQTLRAAVSWGRYAEIYAYDDDRRMFSLENPA
jgi:NitT/TauT family transport system ATP-binding protein